MKSIFVNRKRASPKEVHAYTRPRDSVLSICCYSATAAHRDGRGGQKTAKNSVGNCWIVCSPVRRCRRGRVRPHSSTFTLKVRPHQRIVEATVASICCVDLLLSTCRFDRLLVWIDPYVAVTPSSSCDAAILPVAGINNIGTERFVARSQRNTNPTLTVTISSRKRGLDFCPITRTIHDLSVFCWDFFLRGWPLHVRSHKNQNVRHSRLSVCLSVRVCLRGYLRNNFTRFSISQNAKS